MKIGLVSGIGGIGILAAMIVAFLGWSSSATADFTFPSIDGKVIMTYRCQIKETRVETDENARAAHAFFESVLLETARLQAKAMAASMLPGRPSSEIIPELEVIVAEGDANRKALHRDFRQQFQCQYRGST